MKPINKIIVIVILILCSEKPVFASSENSKDDGTDPTRYTRTAAIQYEHINLKDGFNHNTLNLTYSFPLGEARRYGMSIILPVAKNDVLQNDHVNIGDAAIKLNHVYTMTNDYAVVLAAETAFATAQRTELGTGKNVLKLTAIYARFLEDGAILAPSIVQSNSIGGADSRANINTSSLDFYYVPKLSNPKNSITFDPALNIDWVANTQYASLAVTFGRELGVTYGGTNYLFVKPSVFSGHQRSGNWGLEFGYKIIGF
jgi:hypothetical protein